MRRQKKYIRLLTSIMTIILIGTGYLQFNQKQVTSLQSEAVADTQITTNSDFSVTFLDVGQGNCVLVKNKDKYMLIDGGNRDKSSFVVSYLKKQNIKEFEYLLASHYDADHISGLVGVLHNFNCKKVLDPDYKADSKIYQSFESIILQNEIPQEHPLAGTQYQLDDATITVVSPFDFSAKDENDNSIGVRIEYGNTSFLICGDAQKESEEVMLHSNLNLKSDVYLASHHGSAYSSTKEFLDAVNPKYVIISASYGNSYHHPAKETMERLKARNVCLFRTDLQGTIIVSSDKNNVYFDKKNTDNFSSGEELEQENNDK